MIGCLIYYYSPSFNTVKLASCVIDVWEFFRDEYLFPIIYIWHIVLNIYHDRRFSVGFKKMVGGFFTHSKIAFLCYSICWPIRKWTLDLNNTVNRVAINECSYSSTPSFRVSNETREVKCHTEIPFLFPVISEIKLSFLIILRLNNTLFQVRRDFFDDILFILVTKFGADFYIKETLFYQWKNIIEKFRFIYKRFEYTCLENSLRTNINNKD